MMKTLTKLAATGALLFAGSQAQAIMITDWTHNSGSDPADYTLSIVVDDMMDMDPTNDVFKFTLSVDMGFNADLLALGFNIDEGMSGVSYGTSMPAASGADVTGTFYDTLACGSGCNFNGDGNPGSFDVIVSVGGAGGSGLTSTMFTIATLGFSLDDFTDFGVRAQSTGDDQEGSDKAYSATAQMPVSEATSVAMLGMGLLGLGLVGRIRRSS